MKAHNYYTEKAGDETFVVRDEHDEILMSGTELEASMYIYMRKANQEAIFWKEMFLQLTEYIENKNQ